MNAFLEGLKGLSAERYVSNEETYYRTLIELKRRAALLPVLQDVHDLLEAVAEIEEIIDFVLPTGDWRERIKFGKI